NDGWTASIERCQCAVCESVLGNEAGIVRVECESPETQTLTLLHLECIKEVKFRRCVNVQNSEGGGYCRGICTIRNRERYAVHAGLRVARRPFEPSSRRIKSR